MARALAKHDETKTKNRTGREGEALKAFPDGDGANETAISIRLTLGSGATHPTAFSVRTGGVSGMKDWPGTRREILMESH
jgi:hypothetical protein